MLKREGWNVNHKKVYRLYKQEGLMIRPKRPHKHVTGCWRVGRVNATHPNECWSMDFMSYALYNGQRIWLLTLVDKKYTRESLAIEVGQHLDRQRVVDILTLVVLERGKPE